jgi:putative ABC transport system ATP-binding protein
MSPLVSTRKLRKAYQMGEETVWALDGIDIDIERGEFVSVMGPSGSGKSTFMNLLGCLDRATEGTIKLEDREVSKLGMRELAIIRNRHVGFVFQQFNLLPRTSARDNVMLPLLYSDVPKSQWRKRAEKCLAQVGLANRMHHHPAQLSGGQQQRVAIARALINNPLLIMADEPTGALDSHTGIEIMALFQDLNAQGKTIVLVTHEHDIADFTARKLAFRDGKLLSDERQHPVRAADALAALH